MPDLLADSYALISLLEGNERYRRIFERKKIATTALNVLEVYSTLLRRIARDDARQICVGLLPHTVDVPSEVALLAGEFRVSMRGKKRDCSHIDAWGYASAQYLRIPFLTGDPAFHGLTNVEYVR